MILSQTGRRLSAGENEWKQRLPQVEDISSQQGIRLEVEDTAGGGSTFKVVI